MIDTDTPNHWPASQSELREFVNEDGRDGDAKRWSPGEVEEL